MHIDMNSKNVEPFPMKNDSAVAMTKPDSPTYPSDEFWFHGKLYTKRISWNQFLSGIMEINSVLATIKQQY